MAKMRADTCARGEADLRRALEQAGWRYTRQRAEVFAYLHTVDTHPTAEQVFLAVRWITNPLSPAGKPDTASDVVSATAARAPALFASADATHLNRGDSPIRAPLPDWCWLPL